MGPLRKFHTPNCSFLCIMLHATPNRNSYSHESPTLIGSGSQKGCPNHIALRHVLALLGVVHLRRALPGQVGTDIGPEYASR